MMLVFAQFDLAGGLHVSGTDTAVDDENVDGRAGRLAALSRGSQMRRVLVALWPRPAHTVSARMVAHIVRHRLLEMHHAQLSCSL